jgi:hypothetical protein
MILPKAVRGLRHVVRKKHTAELTLRKHQGRVAQALAIDTTSKDMPASPPVGLNFGMLTGNSSALLG